MKTEVRCCVRSGLTPERRRRCVERSASSGRTTVRMTTNVQPDGETAPKSIRAGSVRARDEVAEGGLVLRDGGRRADELHVVGAVVALEDRRDHAVAGLVDALAG